MKVQPTDVPFLTGEKFTSGLLFSLRDVSGAAAMDRIGLLKEMVKGKSVLHVGCVDHMPLIDWQRQNGIWLHDVLCASASFCAGLDINREGIEHLKKLGFSDVYYCDVIADQLPAELRSRKFDFVILGEMIEHVDNPVEFLSAVRSKMTGIATELITTTPNVFRLQNVIHALKTREYINSDHRYWFSPFTLTKILTRAGYSDVDVEVVWDIPLRKSVGSLVKRVIGALFPVFRDCLVARTKLT